MKKFLIAVFTLLFLNACCQQDSSYLQRFQNFESCPSFQNSLSSKTRSVKTNSFILPATLVTYGVVALNNNRLRNLDITTSEEMHEDQPQFKSNIDTICNMRWH